MLQHETNMNNARERFVWALRGISYNGIPFMAPDAILEDWSEHLSACGFVHVSQVGELADDHDNLDLGKFPYRQEIHFQPPIRGQEHPLNASGEWVPVQQDIQEPMVPASALMTDQEKAKMITEFREEGLLD